MYIIFRAPLTCDPQRAVPARSCKGRQAAVQQTKHLGERGNSREEKEETECFVLRMCGYL